MKSSTEGLLMRAQFYLVILGAIYVAFVGLLTIPFVQRHVIYLNAVKLPLFADFKRPEKFGLAPNKTVNVRITTSDDETIGAWFVMSDRYYRSLPSIPSEPRNHIETALKRHPTILFFHGNAATRAVGVRVRYYKSFTSRMGVNVLAIDYRGFADSSGTPSEEGLVRDGRAAFDWLLSNGANPEDILIMGHSLGTGVSSRLIAQLDAEELACRGVVLLSPFSSIKGLLNTYHILGILPLFRGISMIPRAMDVISWALVHKFDILNGIPDIKSPVLIAHAEDDWEIPYAHSDILFEAFIEPLLPAIPPSQKPLSLTTEEWGDLLQKQEMRSRKRREVVETCVIPNFGTVSSVGVDRSVTLVKTLVGGHDNIVEQEGLQDVIAEKFGLL